MKTTLKPEEYEQRYQMLRQQMGLDDPLIVRLGSKGKDRYYSAPSMEA